MFGKNKNQRKLEATMLSINSILREIYSNKSSDEFKMKGDISKSPSYGDIEKMVADLSTLKGYSKGDASAIKQMFNTLHRPIFKSLVKEYIMEPNDRNTIFTSMYTIGYRLLVGELSRIYSSTQANPSGIVYKPDKISRKEDAGKMIRLFNDDLEAKLDKCVRDLHADPNSASPVNEAYLMEMFNLVQEGFGFREIRNPENVSDEAPKQNDPKAPPKEIGEIGKKSYPKPPAEIGEIQEDAEPVDDSVVDSSEEPDTNVSDSDESVQESMEGVLSAVGKGAAAVGSAFKTVGSVAGLVVAGASAIGALFSFLNGMIAGFNPIARFNYFFMDSYEKKISQLASVSANYQETKKAYEEYMKIPEAKRSKKVESKYIQNMEKYNVTMKNLAAEIEHYNQRAEKEAEETVNETEKKIPNTNAPTSSDEKKPDDTKQDDDFQF